MPSVLALCLTDLLAGWPAACAVQEMERVQSQPVAAAPFGGLPPGDVGISKVSSGSSGGGGSGGGGGSVKEVPVVTEAAPGEARRKQLGRSWSVAY